MRANITLSPNCALTVRETKKAVEIKLTFKLNLAPYGVLKLPLVAELPRLF